VGGLLYAVGREMYYRGQLERLSMAHASELEAVRCLGFLYLLRVTCAMRMVVHSSSSLLGCGLSTSAGPSHGSCVRVQIKGRVDYLTHLTAELEEKNLLLSQVRY
jgi:hypothetical protein